jgi:hypothetical protein
MVVTRLGFSQVVANAFAGLGFPAEAPTVFELPHAVFWTDSDLSPVSENIDKIVYGLTKWEPKTKAKGVTTPPKVTVQGKDYQAAVDNMNNLFLKNMWGDGLPIIPATEERVTWLLTGTDLPPDTVVGNIVPRGGIATVRQLAVALAMSGGRPEYMPVLIAAAQVLVNPAMGLTGWNATTNSVWPAVIVNGPMAKQIRLGSGYGVLGPDPLHPAGASIGRAIRLVLQDMGGALPGVGTMAIHGGAARYTNMVFAEDEAGSPWLPLSEELGVPKGHNAVTMVGINGEVNVIGTDVSTPETAEEALYKFALYMRVPNFNTIGGSKLGGVALVANETAKGLADAGWTKGKIQAYLWENSKVPVSELEKATHTTTRAATTGWRKSVTPGVTSLPIADKPEHILIVVAGGAQAGHGEWLQSMGQGPVSAEITLPKNWDALLKQAEAALGPIPAE